MTLLRSLRDRIINAHPDHHAIAKNMAWVVVFLVLGKLIGAAKEMAIAYHYGISVEVDAYLFVCNLLNWPVGIWFSVLTVVLVPLAARIRGDNPSEISAFRSELLGITLLLGSCLVLLAWQGLPILLRSTWVGLSPNTANIAIKLVPPLVLITLIGVLVSLYSAWMMSAGKQANTLLEGVPAMVILVAVTVFSGGLEPLIWGTLGGVVLQLVCLLVPSIRSGEIEKPRFTVRSDHWSVFWNGFGIMLAGQVLLSFIVVIDQFFAARLGEGSIATLSYANRILALLLSLGATAVARATLPIFSQAESRESGATHLIRVANHWAFFMFVLGVVGVFVGWWLAPWGVRLLFERGAFTADHSDAVTEVLRYGLAQLPFYFSGLVLVSLLSSWQKYKLIAISGGCNLLVKVVANFAFVPFFGIGGIVMANAAMYFVSCILLYRFVISQKEN